MNIKLTIRHGIGLHRVAWRVLCLLVPFLTLIVVASTAPVVWAQQSLMGQPKVDPGSYGLDPVTGKFKHPEAAPDAPGPHPVKGSLTYLEEKEYIKNMEVLKRWPIVVKPGHSWQHIVDMNGRRYMFHYYRTVLKIYDITDPVNLKIILEKTYKEGDWFGAARIAFNKKLNKWIMLQAFEVPRSIGGLEGKKYSEPWRVEEQNKIPGLRGFKVFELVSPTEWKLLSVMSTDVLHPQATIQHGSGGLDAPTYSGGKYAYFAAAPDETFTNMEYPNYVYSPGHMIYDVEDPSNPKLASTWWVPGQRVSEEKAYERWRQYGNRTSWTGARMPIAVPTPWEEGGKYGYTVMGGLGFHILDISNPADLKEVGKVDLPVSVGGVEGDNVDASRANERGIVLTNGYPMNEDCYEPYKDIYVIDVKDPTNPKIISTLPRPVPPKDAPYSDFCLRRGKFGPKRPGYAFQPGKADPNIVVYSFDNAGVQVFDISDVTNAKIVAYFVPKMTDDLKDPMSYITPMESIFVEWDRKLIWSFANSGMYLLTTPALGKPILGPPPVEHATQP